MSQVPMSPKSLSNTLPVTSVCFLLYASGAYETKETTGEAATVAPLSFTAPKFGPPEESTPGPSDYEQPLGVADEANKVGGEAGKG